MITGKKNAYYSKIRVWLAQLSHTSMRRGHNGCLEVLGTSQDDLFQLKASMGPRTGGHNQVGNLHFTSILYLFLMVSAGSALSSHPLGRARVGKCIYFVRLGNGVKGNLPGDVFQSWSQDLTEDFHCSPRCLNTSDWYQAVNNIAPQGFGTKVELSLQ